jgi:alkylation response protein AidB-like acyl-CoA dehydrogenase
MDFSWTSSQQEHYDRVYEFARAEFGARRRERPLEREEWKRCGEFGLLGLCVPADYGGLGLDVLTTARVMEALGRGSLDMGPVFAISAHLFAAVMPIAEYGDEALKRALLPGMCSGELLGANAITEDGAGSDVFSLRTQGRPEAGGYVLSGTKSYATNGPQADVFVVYATVNPAHGYLGVSAFVARRDDPGLTLGETFATLGLRSASACSLFLDDVKIPASRRIGREGGGGEIFQASMQWERACLFAAYVGMMDRQLEQTVEYAKQRRQFGRPIARNQAVAHRLVDMKMRLHSARHALYHACWLRDHGEPALAEISMAKLLISEAAKQSSLDAIQIHGAVGISSDFGVEQMLRDSVPSTLFSGSSEVQRDLIAQSLGVR